MGWDNQDIRELKASTGSSIKCWTAVEKLFRDLVDLNNPGIDALFDKYDVTVEGKYPRKKGG